MIVYYNIIISNILVQTWYVRIKGFCRTRTLQIVFKNAKTDVRIVEDVIYTPVYTIFR